MGWGWDRELHKKTWTGRNLVAEPRAEHPDSQGVFTDKKRKAVGQ